MTIRFNTSTNTLHSHFCVTHFNSSFQLHFNYISTNTFFYISAHTFQHISVITFVYTSAKLFDSIQLHFHYILVTFQLHFGQISITFQLIHFSNHVRLTQSGSYSHHWELRSKNNTSLIVNLLLGKKLNTDPQLSVLKITPRQHFSEQSGNYQN